MAPVKGWDTASEQSILEVDVLEAGKMVKYKDLSDFNKGRLIVFSPSHSL